MASQFLQWLKSQRADVESVRVSRDALGQAGMPRWLILTWTARLKQLERQGLIHVLERSAPRGGGQTHSYLVQLGKAPAVTAPSSSTQTMAVDGPGRFRLIVTVDPQRQPPVLIDVEGIEVQQSAGAAVPQAEIEGLRADLLKLASNLTKSGQQADRVAEDRAQSVRADLERRIEALEERVGAVEQQRGRAPERPAASERPFLRDANRMSPRPRRQNDKEPGSAPETAQRIAREVFGDPNPTRDRKG
ncbi:MAG: hypothetical protein FJX78_01195 [Armatimonadetes bacterium]|nr:hypothetical protein [Armatimonadota bacterium]